MNAKRNISRYSVRSSQGSAIVEGTVAMCMVLSSSILATLLIMNSGAVIFYKTKLSHVNYMAAAYAQTHDGDSALQQETTDYIKTVMSQMSMTPSNLKVTVTPIQVQESSFVQVTIANQFPITGLSGAMIPSQITLQDTEVAAH